MNLKKYSRREKVLYILSLVVVLAMVLGMIAVAVTPYK